MVPDEVPEHEKRPSGIALVTSTLSGVASETSKLRHKIPAPNIVCLSHPSFTKSTPGSTTGDDSSCIERARDRVLAALNQPLFSFWTLITVVHMLCVVGFGAFFFFLFMDDLSAFQNFPLSEDRSHFLQNVGIQVLNGLFTWSALMGMPWRLSNATHLTYNTGKSCFALGKPRSCAVGLDFYGKPTEMIWFNIPPFHRRMIIGILLLGTFSQFTTQTARWIFSTYEEANSPPGHLWCNVSFFMAMGFNLLGALYQLLQERKLRRVEPERFPSGVIDSVAVSYRGWRRGQWHILPQTKWQQEASRKAAVKAAELRLTNPGAAAEASVSTSVGSKVLEKLARAAG